ncbi:hypothetical protein GUJ93_ZPchr0004g39299 [Zizania palustris]|uniref:Uncharacterized protein n=1 Tax=Zizania palustris TaxID=103762 RepID=A0A8J5VQ65_ZIZPA|nr:hypothetical protein GUJ93_ZPchr0004g39299 [Zizania palustris]
MITYSRVSLPTGLEWNARCCGSEKPPPPLLISPVSRRSEAPEAKQMRLETEASLEWEGGVHATGCILLHFRGTRCLWRGAGRSREPGSERMLEKTAAAAAVVGSAEDLSAVIAAADGGLLSVREICGVGRSIPSAREVFDQLRSLSEVTPDERRNLVLA